MSRVRALALVASIVAGLVAIAPAAHAASRGSIAVKVVAPRGVAASVKIVSGKRSVVAAKPPSGTVKTSKLSAPTGTWRPVLAAVSIDGRLYKPASRPSKVKVTNQRTAKLTVTFKEVKVARDLDLASVEEQSARLSFTRSSVRKAATRIRLATGTKAPTSHTSGRPATIVSPGRAEASGLTPGTTYTAGLFTKIGKTWYGPIARTFSTEAVPSESKTTAQFVVADDAVLLSTNDRFEATPVREPVQAASKALDQSLLRRSAAPPATLSVPTVDLRLFGQTARINQTYVVPQTNRLPGGFVGSVVSVSASGVARLQQAPVSDALDKADINVPKIDVPAKTLTPRQGTAGSACALGADAAWDITPPTVTIEGSGDFKLDSSGFKIDSKVVATLDASIGAHLDAAVTCDFKLPTIRQAFAAGPIPMALEFKPTVKASAEGTVKVTGFGFQAKAGYTSHVELPLPGRGGISADTKTIKDFEWKTPSATAAGDLNVKAAGTLDIGPGVASDVAGLTAGITGTFTPLDAHAGIKSDSSNGACITASAGGSASLGVKAKAWVNLVIWKYEASAQHDIFKTAWDYGKRQSWPAGCNAPSIKTTSLPDGAVGSAYSARLETTDNRNGQWSIADGELPLGLSLVGDSISGTPSSAGTARLAVGFDDGDSSTTRSFTITIRPDASATFATARMSTSSNDDQAGKDSFSPRVSGDGRYVVFSSNASNLVAEDSNDDADVFIKDRSTGITERVSTAAGGAQADHGSYDPAVSADGRYVTFDSYATNLVPGDVDGQVDVFVKDLTTGAVERISATAEGAAGDEGSYAPRISADGRYIAFSSDATNLVPHDTNAARDIFVKDRATGTLVRLSTSTDAMQADSDSTSVDISADGRFVTYSSAASNLVPYDTNRQTDVFVTNRATGATSRISTSTDGDQSDGSSSDPSISADGRYVAYWSNASNLLPGDTNGRNDVFLADRTTGTTTRLSTAADGTQANDSCWAPSISSDGSYVAYWSSASNLVDGDTNGVMDVFTVDRRTRVPTRISTATDGTQADKFSGPPVISADGRDVVYESTATNLVASDTNNVRDVFVTRWR